MNPHEEPIGSQHFELDPDLLPAAGRPPATPMAAGEDTVIEMAPESRRLSDGAPRTATAMHPGSAAGGAPEFHESLPGLPRRRTLVRCGGFQKTPDEHNSEDAEQKAHWGLHP